MWQISVLIIAILVTCGSGISTAGVHNHSLVWSVQTVPSLSWEPVSRSLSRRRPQPGQQCEARTGLERDRPCVGPQCHTTPLPVSQAPEPVYTGPKALLAVLDFEDETSSAGTFDPALGRGMRTMLKEALMKSPYFIVLDLDMPVLLPEPSAPSHPAPSLKPVKNAKARPGRSESPVPATRQLPPVLPDIVVTAAVTAFEPDDRGNTAKGGGALLKKLPFTLPTIIVEQRQARVLVALRFLDARTRQILAAETVLGTAEATE